MAKPIFHIVTFLLTLGFGITNSCSQSAITKNLSTYGVFEASTPCNDESRKLLATPQDAKCEFMKWKLTLFQDSKTSTPSTFHLTCVYGLAKQASRDFLDGAKTTELKGKCTIRKGIGQNQNTVIFTLTSDNSLISLSFIQPGPNLLHLLNKEDHLMIGNGAWSYTLNRVDPIPVAANAFIPQATSIIETDTDSATVGAFEGRTPCGSSLREINNITADGCQIIKCRLILSQDIKTHSPTTFQLQTIYVGKGDTRYTNTGKWIVTKGTKNDPSAIVYRLQPDSIKPHEPIILLKADRNILFFLNKNGEFMIGNNYCSYTLNRAEK